MLKSTSFEGASGQGRSIKKTFQKMLNFSDLRTPWSISLAEGFLSRIFVMTQKYVCVSVGSNPNITNFELRRSQVCSQKPNLEPTQTPSKSPNFEPVRPETRQTQEQIWKKNRTSNPSEPRLVYQNRTTNPPEPSKNPEHRTHELGSTQH